MIITINRYLYKYIPYCIESIVYYIYIFRSLDFFLRWGEGLTVNYDNKLSLHRISDNTIHIIIHIIKSARTSKCDNLALLYHHNQFMIFF